MSESFDTRVRQLLHEIADATPVRDALPPTTLDARAGEHRLGGRADHRSRHRARRGLAVLGAAAAVMVVLVIVGRDPEHQVRTVDTVAPSSEAPSPTATSTAQSPPTSTSVAERSAPDFGLIDVGGGPVGLAVVPDGFHLDRVDEVSGGNFAGSQNVDWWAEFLEFADGRYTGRQFAVQVVKILPGDDPYVSYPGVAPEPITFGEYTGRVQGGPEDATFVAPLDGGQALVVIGHIGVDVLPQIVNGLTPRTATAGFDVAVPPGFETVFDGPGMIRGPERSWIATYAADDGTSAFMVTADLRPGVSADSVLTFPEATQVEVLGRRATAWMGQVLFDVSPDLKVTLAPGTRETTILGEAATVPLDLVAVAQHLQPFPPAEWDALLAGQPAAPPVTLDLGPQPAPPCNLPSVTLEKVTDDGGEELGDFTNSEWTLLPGDGVRVEVKPRSGVVAGPITVLLRRSDGATVVLESLERIDRSTALDVTWDGTIDGRPAAKGRYRISIDAPVISDDDACQAPDITELLVGGAYAVL